MKKYEPVQMEIVDINGCPFCGGKSEIKIINGKFTHGWVGCPSCGIYKNWAHDPAGAIEKWNRRAR